MNNSVRYPSPFVKSVVAEYYQAIAVQNRFDVYQVMAESELGRKLLENADVTARDIDKLTRKQVTIMIDRAIHSVVGASTLEFLGGNSKDLNSWNIH